MLVSLVRQLSRKRASVQWWIAFFTLALVGILAGIWVAFHFEYSLGTRSRLGSFPIPIVLFRLEDGQWTDFPVPAFQAWASVFTNIITITAFALLPVWVASWRHHRHSRA